jgi:hypothetical protein
MIALAAGLALLGGSTAWAQTLDFTVPAVNPGASISYDGSTDLVGTGIRITDVTGESTPLNNLITQLITGGVLTFNTGKLTSFTTSPATWSFGGGGANSILITGGMSTPSIPGGTTLLSGTVESATVTEGGGNFKVAVAAFFNTINSTLAGYYGVPTTGWSGNFNIGFNAAGTPPGAFSSTNVSSGDVITSVPEPSSLAIAGLGALGMIGVGLRRRTAVKA